MKKRLVSGGIALGAIVGSMALALAFVVLAPRLSLVLAGGAWVTVANDSNEPISDVWIEFDDGREMWSLHVASVIEPKESISTRIEPPSVSGFDLVFSGMGDGSREHLSLPYEPGWKGQVDVTVREGGRVAATGRFRPARSKLVGAQPDRAVFRLGGTAIELDYDPPTLALRRGPESVALESPGGEGWVDVIASQDDRRAYAIARSRDNYLDPGAVVEIAIPEDAVGLSAATTRVVLARQELVAFAPQARLLTLKEADSGRLVIELITRQRWLGFVKVPTRALCSLELPTGELNWMEGSGR